jgi:tetratricopeptide (TPR) repeat protein
VLLGTLALWGTSPVAAQADEDGREAEARQAFLEGREHFEDERFRLAVESFRRAYALLEEVGSPMAPTILYNVATALDELPGHQVEARDTYRRFLDEAPEGDDPELHRTVEMRIRELDMSIEEQVTLDADTDVEAPRPEAEGQPAEESMSIVGPIVAAGGGALLITGAILGGIALGQGNDIEEACPELSGCSPALQSDYDQMRTRSVTADVLIFGGLAIAAVGAVLMFTLKDGANEDVSVGAACDGQGCYASARGNF